MTRVTTPKKNTHPGQGQVQDDETGDVIAIDDTSTATPELVEQGLIRGLIGAPANRVLSLANTLVPHDFHAPHNHTVFAAVVACAHALVEAGCSDAPVAAERVQQHLQQAGALQQDTVARALIAVSTGAYLPPAWPDVEHLALGMKQARLRRALVVVGEDCLATATASTQEIARCLSRLGGLVDVARRAGVEVA